MRKALILASAVGILTISCKKEEEHCWSCTYTFSGQKPDRTGDTVLCHLTKTDIELRDNIKLDATAAGYDTWILTNCQQQ
ncbi:MAG: hypothetical protein KDC07_06620 [Chitinophagaceae bacterium]|nr:hypothetical protein [Chitinophagaceae bacterium]